MLLKVVAYRLFDRWPCSGRYRRSCSPGQCSPGYQPRRCSGQPTAAGSSSTHQSERSLFQVGSRVFFVLLAIFVSFVFPFPSNLIIGSAPTRVYPSSRFSARLPRRQRRAGSQVQQGRDCTLAPRSLQQHCTPGTSTTATTHAGQAAGTVPCTAVQAGGQKSRGLANLLRFATRPRKPSRRPRAHPKAPEAILGA
jgi:hypothetical protein